MKTLHKTFEYKTHGGFHVMDVSDEIIAFVKESGVENGLLNIQTMHTTAGLLLNENEPLLLKDLEAHYEGLSPGTASYRHDDLTVRTVNVCDDECANGHAHLKASHLAATATLNVVNGKLQLGQWQRVLFIELDRSRPRKLQVMVIGE
jgi:secondary thiamine-phosphate synthase enzyme